MSGSTAFVEQRPFGAKPNPRSSNMVFAAMQTRLGNAFAYRWSSASMLGRWNPLPNFGRRTSCVAAVSTLKQFSPPSAE
jgi:hypothetical protein